MDIQKYESCLAWSLNQGLDMDSRLERKQVNGVYGMYAKSHIPKGTVLASFPKDKLIPNRKDVSYPNGTPETIKKCHAAAIELSKGEASDYFGCVAAFESLEALQSHSFYFFSNEELKFIENLNPVLYKLMLEAKHVVETAKQQIQAIDPDLAENAIIQTVLNSFSRSWGQNGFVPVLDLFNHSDRKGLNLKNLLNDKIGHVTGIDYQAGEQIFINYSKKDMLNQAIIYNYFDPTGVHFIDYSVRVIQAVNSELQQKVLGMIATQYPIQQNDINGVRHFRLVPQNLFFQENAPSVKLFEYFQVSSIQTEKELVEKEIIKIVHKEERSSNNEDLFMARTRHIEALEKVKSALIKALLMTPSRSKNTAFFIHQFIFLIQTPILFHLILILDVKQLNAKLQLERLRYVE